MNDRGDAFGGILADAFPNAHDIAAGGINNLATAGFDIGHHINFRTECRNDDDVALLQAVEVGRCWARGKVFDAQGLHLRVDIRVVDDFAEEKNPAVGKNFSCSVGEVDGALDAVAEAKLLG